jgi:hypothetical protein
MVSTDPILHPIRTSFEGNLYAYFNPIGESRIPGLTARVNVQHPGEDGFEIVNHPKSTGGMERS